MRRFITSLAIMLLFTILVSDVFSQITPNQREQILRTAIPATVNEVIDAIHLHVTMNGTPEIIRLQGCALPDEAIQVEAKKETQRFTLGQTVYILADEDQVDEDGTIPALVYYADGWFLLNASLIDRGYATYNNDDTVRFDDEFQGLERTARERHVGMWRFSHTDRLRAESSRVTERSNQDMMDRYGRDGEEGVSNRTLPIPQPDRPSQDRDTAGLNWPYIFMGFNLKNLLEAHPDTIEQLESIPQWGEIQERLDDMNIDLERDIDTLFAMVSQVTSGLPSILIYATGSFQPELIQSYLIEKFPNQFETQPYRNVTCLLSQEFNRAPSMAFMGENLIIFSTPDKLHEGIDLVLDNEQETLLSNIRFADYIQMTANRSNLFWMSLEPWDLLRGLTRTSPDLAPLAAIDLILYSYSMNNDRYLHTLSALCKTEAKATELANMLKDLIESQTNTSADNPMTGILSMFLSNYEIYTEGKEMGISIEMTAEQIQSLQQMAKSLLGFNLIRGRNYQEPGYRGPVRPDEPASPRDSNSEESVGRATEPSDDSGHRSIFQREDQHVRVAAIESEPLTEAPKNTDSFDSSIPAGIFVVPEEEVEEPYVPEEEIIYKTSETSLWEMITKMLEEYQEVDEDDPLYQEEEAEWDALETNPEGC